MRHLSSLLEMLNLGRQRLLQESALQTARRNLRQYRLMKPVQDSRDRGEEVWLDDLGVFEESQVVACAVCDDSTGGDSKELEGSLWE